MPLLVCPVCGAETIVSGTRGVEKCTFCGVEMPLTSRTNLLESVFNSATRARIAFDFDRAEELYQAHLKHFPADEDALFGMLMCRYGVVFHREEGGFVPRCYQSSLADLRQERDYLLIMNRSQGRKKELFSYYAGAIDRVRETVWQIPMKSDEAMEDPLLLAANDVGEGAALPSPSNVQTLSQTTGGLTESQKAELYRQADAYLQAGDYYRAVDLFNLATTYDPTFSRAYFVALLAEFCCPNADALVVCEQSEWLDSENLKAAMQYADPKDLDFYRDLINRRYEALRQLSQKALNAGGYERCLEYCHTILAHDPQNGAVWWIQTLAENGVSNSAALKRKCLRSGYSVSRSASFLRALEGLPEREARVLQKVAADIDRAVQCRNCSELYEQSQERMCRQLEIYRNMVEKLKKYRGYAKELELDTLDAYRKSGAGQIFYNNVLFGGVVALILFLSVVLIDIMVTGQDGTTVYSVLRRDFYITVASFVVILLIRMIRAASTEIVDEAERDFSYRDGELHSVLYGIRHITAVSQNLQVIYDRLVDSKGADEKQIAELNREFDGINSALLDFIDRNGWNVFADQIRDEKK